MAVGPTVEEYLERFVAEFVVVFEEYFSEHHLYLQTKISKHGNWFKLIEFISNLGRAVERGSIVKLEKTVWMIGVLQTMAHSVGVYYEDDKMKRVSAVMADLSNNPAVIRQTLLKAAARIFQSFESQLVRMEIDRNWCDLDKVVHDAVNRVISYYKKNPGTEFNFRSVTVAVIKGESKHYHGSFLPRGHTVTINNTSVNTKELFEKVEVRGRSDALANSELGFRLPFDWEQSWSEADLKNLHEFSVDRDMIMRIIRKVSNDIDDGLEVGKFDETLQKISQDAEKDVARIWLLIEDQFSEVMQCLYRLSDELNGKIRKCVTFKDEGQLNQSLERVWFDLHAPIELFVGRSNELEDLHRKIRRSAPSVTVTAICGSAGMGKTYLARQFTYLQCIATPIEFYHIIWMNAENETLLVDSFLRLAKRISHPIRGSRMEFIVNDVYKFLSNRRTLIVFDNVENIEFLKCYLPLPFINTKVSILIITRCNDWSDSIEKLNVSAWERMHAEEFVRSSLSMKGELKDSNVHKLVETLKYFPLALSMAVAYIKGQSCSVNCTVNVFLRKYESKRNNHLKLQSSDDILQYEYTEIIYKVWNVSCKKIERYRNGELAERMLNILALMSSEKINREIFYVQHLKNDLCLDSCSEGDIRMELEDAFSLLEKYSLVDGQDWQCVSINRLIQEMTRQRMKNCEKLREEAIQDTFEIIRSALVIPENVSDVAGNRRQFASLESFLSHVTVLKIESPERSPVVGDLFRFLNRMGEAYGAIGELGVKKGLHDAAFAVAENYYGKNNCKVASALNKIADAFDMMGKPQEKKECLAKALEIEEKYGGDNSEMIVTLNNLGNTFGTLGEYNKMVEYLERVLYILESQKVKRKNTESRICTVLHNLSVAYGELRHHKKQRDCLQRALEIYDLHDFNDDLQKARLINNLGNAYGALGEHSKQLKQYEIALSIRMQVHGQEDNLDVARSLHNLGVAYGDLGNHEKKKSLLERALTIENQLYGTENHIEMATTFYNLGITWGKLGDRKMKTALLEKALGIETRHFGENSIKTVITTYNLAISYRELGDYERSLNLLLRTLKIQEEHFKEETIDIFNTLNALSDVYGLLGDYINQVKVLERALKVQIKYYKPSSLKITGTLDCLGVAYGVLGEYYKQKEYFTRCLGIRERRIESNQQEVARSLNNLGNAEYNLRNYQGAREKYESALRIEEKLFKEEFIRMTHILKNIGLSYYELEDYGKAKEFLEKSSAMNVEQYSGEDEYEMKETYMKIEEMCAISPSHDTERDRIESVFSCNWKQCAIKFFSSIGNSNLERIDIEKKRDLLKRTLEIEERDFTDRGLDNIDIATTIYKLGIVNGELGDHEEKVALLERALKIQEDHFRRDNNEISRTLLHLGEAYGQLGDYQKQKEVLEEVLAINAKNGIAIPKLVATIDLLGNAYSYEGNLTKQKELYDWSLSIKQKYYGIHHCEVAKTLNNLGTVHYFSKDYSSAIKLYEKAFAIEQKLLCDGYSEIAHILNNLGHCLMCLNEIQESDKCLREAMKMMNEQNEVDETNHCGLDRSKSTKKLMDSSKYEKLRKKSSVNSPLTLNDLAHLKDNVESKNTSKDTNDTGESDYEVAMKLRQIQNTVKLSGGNESGNMLNDVADDLMAEYFENPTNSHLKYILTNR